MTDQAFIEKLSEGVGRIQLARFNDDGDESEDKTRQGKKDTDEIENKYMDYMDKKYEDVNEKLAERSEGFSQKSNDIYRTNGIYVKTIVKCEYDDGPFPKTIVQAKVQLSPTWRGGSTDKKDRRREWDKEKQNCRRGQYFFAYW